jgi:hypothetical protein
MGTSEMTTCPGCTVDTYAVQRPAVSERRSIQSVALHGAIATSSATAYLLRANASAPRLVTDSGTSVVSATRSAAPASTPFPTR